MDALILFPLMFVVMWLLFVRPQQKRVRAQQQLLSQLAVGDEVVTSSGLIGTLTAEGRLNLRNARFARDEEPLDPACSCAVCARWSRAYLRHLLQVDEPTAPRLVTLHNVAWTLDLVTRMRVTIEAGTFTAFRTAVAGVWG